MNPSSNPPAGGAQASRPAVEKLIRERRFREASSLCGTLRGQFPDDGWLTAMHAFANLRLGQNQHAAALAAEAMRLGTDQLVAPFSLGLANRRMGRHAEAAEALEVANRQAPGHGETAAFLLEEVAAARGLDAARALFPKVWAGAPDHQVATTWARLLFRAGQEDELPAGRVVAPLMSVRAWMAKTGVSMDWEGEREKIPFEEPFVFGEPASGGERRYLDGYAPYVATLRDATVFSGCTTILTSDGVALNDVAADETYGQYIDFMSDVVVADRRDDRLLLAPGRYPVSELDAGILLAGSVSEHFGHWLPEYLSKLRYLAQHPRFASLPIIVDEHMPAQHFEYLGLVVSNPLVRLATGRALRCRELVVASASTFFPVHLTPDHKVPYDKAGGGAPANYQFIKDRIEERLPPPASRERKLYLSRRKRAGRRPHNEDEISAVLAARGFEIVFPEDLSLSEQIALFQSARVVVLSNGSSVLNALFAATDTRLFVLSQRGLFNWGTWVGLMGELGYAHTFVCGDEATDYKNESYTIPIERLLAALDAPPR